MKKISKFLIVFIFVYLFMLLTLKACDHEAEQNEIKNTQWVEDIENGKPFTNYGE